MADDGDDLVLGELPAECRHQAEIAGVECSAVAQPIDSLLLTADYTYTDSQFSDEPSNANRIPGAVESTFTLGANMLWDNGWSSSVRLRYLGETPLTQDGNVKADDSLLVNADCQ